MQVVNLQSLPAHYFLFIAERTTIKTTETTLAWGSGDLERPAVQDSLLNRIIGNTLQSVLFRIVQHYHSRRVNLNPICISILYYYNIQYL
jgi:hypothetical protein